MRLRLVCAAAVLLSGCATVPPQQVGQMVGTLAGSVIVPGVGAPLGSLVGLLTGMVLQQQVDKVTEKKERVTLGQELHQTHDGAAAMAGMDQPLGVPTRVWVDETVRAGRVIAGSFQERYI